MDPKIRATAVLIENDHILLTEQKVTESYLLNNSGESTLARPLSRLENNAECNFTPIY
jgi:hypothetical protein